MLRAVLASSIVIEGGFYLRAADAAVIWFAGLLILAVGLLLLIGFLTPIAGVVAGLNGIAVGLSLLPASSPNLFVPGPALIFATTMLIAIVFLGPGAFSLDARLFGRREIIIPPRSVPPER